MVAPTMTPGVRNKNMTQTEMLPFDAIIGSEKPTDSFGSIFEDEEYELTLSQFEIFAIEVKESLRDRFDLVLSDLKTVTDELDNVISEFWSEGWVPEKNNSDLFCSHFGTILATFLNAVPNTKIIFRSSTELNNLSI